MFFFCTFFFRNTSFGFGNFVIDDDEQKQNKRNVMTVVMATTLCWICIFSLILWAHMAANGCNDVPDYVYDDCESRIGLPVDNWIV